MNVVNTLICEWTFCPDGGTKRSNTANTQITNDCFSQIADKLR